MLTGNGRSKRFAKMMLVSAVACLLTVAAVSQTEASSNTSGAIRTTATAAPAFANDVLDGITLGGMYTDADVTYLRESLQLLSDKMPAWAQYVEESKPLVLGIDLTQGAQGRAAIAKCCLAGNRGMITFGHHFGTLVDSSDPDSQSPEARRITFLATLAHEVTHVRDQRAGKFLAKTNRKTCIAAEKSGLDKQLEFQQDALTVELGNDAASTQTYRARLAQNVQAEAAALHSRGLWEQYCGAFDE